MIRSFLLVSLAVLSGWLAPVQPCAAEPSLAGGWVGGFERGEEYVFLRLQFKAEDGKVSGTYDAPLRSQQGSPIKQVNIKSSTVTFEVPGKPHAERFAGELREGELTGQVKDGTTEHPFRFTRLASIEPEDYAGAYEIEPGHFVFIRPAFEVLPGALLFIDFKTQRLGVLFATSTTRFFTGPGLFVPHPVEGTVTFTLDAQGKATGFAWAGDPKWNGRRVRLRQEEVSFTNGGVTLAGTLVSPQTVGPHPVVVFVPANTTAATREMGRHLAEFYALHGVAALIYDKRGLGRSTGDWLRAGFDDLAGDALAAVRMLKLRPDIEARRIGLFGNSQAGWIVARAAARSKEVAFIISQSGPGVTPEAQELFRQEAGLRDDGFSEKQIADAMKFIRQRYACARTGEGWDVLAEAERGVRDERWFAFIGGHIAKDNPFWHFWRLIRDYDPVPDLEKVTCPVLAVLGEKDTLQPTEPSARIWRAALQRAGNKDVTIRVFPDGDHGLIESRTGGLKETARARRFVPGYFETLRDWTLERVERPY